MRKNKEKIQVSGTTYAVVAGMDHLYERIGRMSEEERYWVTDALGQAGMGAYELAWLLVAGSMKDKSPVSAAIYRLDVLIGTLKNLGVVGRSGYERV